MGNVNWGLWSGGVPTYGNYGGPNYTGGEIGGGGFDVDPVDEFDEAFRQHDQAYKSELLSQRTAADKELFDTISKLKETSAWDQLSVLDKAFINAVLPVFTGKIIDRKAFNFQQQLEQEIISRANTPECFLAGTMIDMWPLGADLSPSTNGHYDEKAILAQVWQKPIEEVTPEDWVVSYDDEGRLKPGRVTRTFQNRSKHILDVHGLMVTPGHVTYCAPVEGEEHRFAGKHVPIMDILRSDGALQKADGTLIRAATGCEVGTADDEQFWAFLIYEDANGNERVRDKCQLRLGTRWMLPNGNHFSMREYMHGIGAELIEEGPHKGYMRFKQTGQIAPFAWTLSESLPKPEDFVLQRSQLTLEEIYEADEWEEMRPQMPVPNTGEAGRSYNQASTLYAGASANHQPPNVPHSMKNSSNQPTMSRKQRRAMEAKQRKAKKRASVTVH